MTGFVILSSQRSGSTWVVDLLNSHAEVTCYGELLLPGASGRRPAGAQDRPFFAETEGARPGRSGALRKHAAARRYLDDLYRSPGLGRAAGFKLMYSQLRRFPWLPGYFALRQIRIVHHVRARKVDQVLSQIEARTRSRFHAVEGDRVDREPVKVDPAQLLAEVRKLERQTVAVRRMLRLLPMPRIEISYERLLESELELGRLLSFIDVTEQAPLSTRLQKLASRPYEERIANFAEVSAALASTELAGALSRREAG